MSLVSNIKDSAVSNAQNAVNNVKDTAISNVQNAANNLINNAKNTVISEVKSLVPSDILNGIMGILTGNESSAAAPTTPSATPMIGFIGKFIFMSNSFSVKTFESLTRKVEPRFVEHDVIYGKPISEFTGNNLNDLTFSIILNKDLGVDPLEEYEGLKETAESGVPQPIFLYGKSLGKFTIRDVQTDEKHWRNMRPVVIPVSLLIREFIDSLSSEAETKVNEDESKRKETGLGGPIRLEGAAQAIQNRVLTAVKSEINSVVSNLPFNNNPIVKNLL